LKQKIVVVFGNINWKSLFAPSTIAAVWAYCFTFSCTFICEYTSGWICMAICRVLRLDFGHENYFYYLGFFFLSFGWVWFYFP
jgi:hypothetical protein